MSPEKEPNSDLALAPCEFRLPNDESGILTCEIASRLSKIDVRLCVVKEEACRACMACPVSPETPNFVTASLAISAVTNNDKKRTSEILEEMKPYLRQVRGTPVKRVTAEEIPCSHRGPHVRTVKCEICGSKGQDTPVYHCHCKQLARDDGSPQECTASSWTTDKSRSHTLTCLTCPVRLEEIDRATAVTQEDAESTTEASRESKSEEDIAVVTLPPSRPIKLTIGMATYDDWPGVWATVQSLRMHHADVLREMNAELIVVDSNPKGLHSPQVKALLDYWIGAGRNGRYVAMDWASGTSAPRNQIFREARGEMVLCVDCHVLLVPGALQAFVGHLTSNPASLDLIQGPLLDNGLNVMATHMDSIWGEDLMFGKWASDARGMDPDLPPFEIPMHGLGLFGCRKTAWLGFHPKFRGFGGEEGYIHEKYRQAGRKTLCLPALQWDHRWGYIQDKAPYPCILEDRFHNYLVGIRELGLDPSPVLAKFAGKFSDAAYGKIVKQALEAQP